MDPLTYFVVWVVTTAAMIALAPKPPKPKPAALTDFDLPVAEEGRPIPVVFGTVNCTGANVLWYGDLKARAIRKSGLFSSTTVGYKYYLGLHFGLCHGPVNSITGVRVGDVDAWTGTVTSSSSITIDRPGLFGGQKREGGLRGIIDFEMGGPTQAANSYLTSAIGGTIPGHRGILGAVFRGITSGGGYVGNSAYVKPFAFRIKRTTAGWHGGTAWYTAKAEIDGRHANGAHVLYEALTNPTWGMGLDTSLIDSTSWTAAADKLYAEGFGLSLIWNQQSTIESFVQTILEHVAGAIVFRLDTGKYELRLLRGDYTASTLPLYDESNVLALERREVRGWGDTTNEITLVYTDPDSYKTTSITAQDLAGIAIQGRVAQTVQMPAIHNSGLAAKVAERELAARVVPMSVVTLRVNRAAWDANQGDLFRLTWPKHGFAGVVFRVLKIQKGTLEDGTITIDALQDVYALNDGIGAYVSTPAVASVPVETEENEPESAGASVKSATTTTPPASPADGDTYYVPTGATGAWAGHAGEIATWDAEEAAWQFAEVTGNPVVYNEATSTYVTLVGDGTTSTPPWASGLVWTTAPATTSSTGIAGQIAYDASYIYVCTATNTWRRAEITTW
jgi:hypothetical protein